MCRLSRESVKKDSPRSDRGSRQIQGEPESDQNGTPEISHSEKFLNLVREVTRVLNEQHTDRKKEIKSASEEYKAGIEQACNELKRVVNNLRSDFPIIIHEAIIRLLTTLNHTDTHMASFWRQLSAWNLQKQALARWLIDNEPNKIVDRSLTDGIGSRVQISTPIRPNSNLMIYEGSTCLEVLMRISARDDWESQIFSNNPLAPILLWKLSQKGKACYMLRGISDLKCAGCLPVADQETVGLYKWAEKNGVKTTIMSPGLVNPTLGIMSDNDKASCLMKAAMDWAVSHSDYNLIILFDSSKLMDWEARRKYLVSIWGDETLPKLNPHLAVSTELWQKVLRRSNTYIVTNSEFESDDVSISRNRKNFQTQLRRYPDGARFVEV
jgi:hypothetical protein